MTPADILALRRRLGLTQADLGNLLGTGTGGVLVCRWERGKATPSAWQVSMLEAFAYANPVDPATFGRMVRRVLAESEAACALFLVLDAARKEGWGRGIGVGTQQESGTCE